MSERSNVYLRGECRYGSRCALPHSKPNAPSSSTYTPPKATPATPRAPVSEHVASGSGSTYADYANAILARKNSDNLPDLDQLSLNDPKAPPSYGGFRSEEPWPSDMPEEFTYSDPESDDEDDTVFYPPPPTSSYSAALRTNADTAGASNIGVVVERSSTNSPRAGADNTLCPFALNGNCKFGDKCRYTHGLQCPSCEKYCLHPDASDQEHEEHLRACIDKQDEIDRQNALTDDSESMECVVCMERVMGKQDPRFGLLNCDHCVCLECIRTWRTNEGMDTSKRCPICREVTHFVVPSAVWVVDPAEKERVIEDYKYKLSQIDCKHYNHGEGSCPFGTSCHYRHIGRDGVPEEVKLRVVKDDDEGVRVVNTPKLADFIDAWDGQRSHQ
ncbi:hypothetical protein HDV00_002804 [Rhizophlyctis rosea]|nr:hypothetical protein HDV00_002804 [Rhizophlyctis rosea]